MKNISKAIFGHFATATGLPVVYYPNVKAEVPTAEHIIVSILPAETMAIGITSGNQSRGVISALVKVKENVGAVRAYEIADLIIDRFARNTELIYGTTKVRIDKKGYCSPSLTGDGWYALPVTIPYNSIA